MTEKRYIVKGVDDFFQHIEDTTLTEDKHEGAIYNIYQVVDKLNEQEERIQELETENATMKGRIINAIRESEKVQCDCRECVCEIFVMNTLKENDGDNDD